MNFNSKPGGRQPAFGRKVKRVSDVNAMGYTPYDQPNVPPPQQNLYPSLDVPENNVNHYQGGYVEQPGYRNEEYVRTPQPPRQQSPNYGFNQTPYPGNMGMQTPMQSSQLGQVFGTPIVQDMAVQYGQQLAGAGKTLIKQEVEKYVPLTKLKYYFAVDTKYVVSKLMILFFPFTHSDWSVKYEQDGPVQPRFEINAPDLYIPTMSYVTYVLVAGLVLGMQQRFSPEQIGITASSALAWCIIELAVYSATLYVIQAQTSLKTLDLLAYSGYKFVGIITSVVVSLVAGKMGFYAALAYCSFALAFFLIRTLKAQVLVEHTTQPGFYGQAIPQSGNKRRLYFLLFVAGLQPVLSWWLSFHLLAAKVPAVASSTGAVDL